MKKRLDFERVNNFNLNHTFFFRTEANDDIFGRHDYLDFHKVVNKFNGNVVIYPCYDIDGEEVRMPGIMGNSPAIYVAIIDSIIEYCEAAGESKDREKWAINSMCEILRLSNDRDEAIATLSEYVDMYDSESDVPNLEDSQVALMEYLPVFYDTTESAYTYYCDVMRLTEEKDNLSDARYAFHRLQASMAFLKNLAKERVKECVEIMASATFRDVNRVEIAKNVSESLKRSMDGIRDFSSASRSAIESLIVELDTYVANPDKELWNRMWQNPLRKLRDNLFHSDREVRDAMTDVMKKLGLTH